MRNRPNEILNGYLDWYCYNCIQDTHYLPYAIYLSLSTCITISLSFFFGKCFNWLWNRDYCFLLYVRVIHFWWKRKSPNSPN
jgi:hypothetical protein